MWQGAATPYFQPANRNQAEAGLLVCCWGNHGTHRLRSFEVTRMLHAHRVTLHHLGPNAGGEPKHPLYLRATTEPTKWEVLG